MSIEASIPPPGRRGGDEKMIRVSEDFPEVAESLKHDSIDLPRTGGSRHEQHLTPLSKLRSIFLELLPTQIHQHAVGAQCGDAHLCDRRARVVALLEPIAH